MEPMLSIPAQVIGWAYIFIGLLIIVSVWEIIWKGIAMWKAARHNQMHWFICILVFNTIGILPILYIVFFQKKEKKKVLKKKR